MNRVLPYIPFINYKQKWINEKLYIIKSKRNDIFIRDDDGKNIGWSVIEYILCLLYDWEFFGLDFPKDGLRIQPHELKYYLKN